MKNDGNEVVITIGIYAIDPETGEKIPVVFITGWREKWLNLKYDYFVPLLRKLRILK
jgi:hypothetical protein